jgi:hypothetical protein
LAQGDADPIWGTPDVFSLLRRKEETLALLLEESGTEDPA